MNVNAYINNTGPYITPFEQYQMNEKENKKINDNSIFNSKKKKSKK